MSKGLLHIGDVAYLKDSKGNFCRRKTGYYISIYDERKAAILLLFPGNCNFLATLLHADKYMCSTVICMQRCFCHVIQQYIKCLWRDVVLTEDHQNENFHAKDTRKSQLKSTQ